MKKIVFTVLFFFAFMTFSNFACASESLQAINAYNAGIDFYAKDDTQSAIKSFREAIKIDPDFQEAYYNLAQILASENQINEAISLYQTALTIDEFDFQSMFSLSELLFQKKQYQNALNYINKIPQEVDVYKDAQKLKLALEAKIKEAQALQAAKEKEAQAQKQRLTGAFLPVKIYNDIKNPSGITSDTLGNLYIASFSANTVYKYNQNGAKSTFVSPSILNGPLGLAVDKNNNLYIANYNAGNILKVLPSGAPYIFVKVQKPYIISVKDNFLYVTEQGTNTVLKYEL